MLPGHFHLYAVILSCYLFIYLPIGIGGDQWEIEYFFENTYHPSNESGCYLVYYHFWEVFSLICVMKCVCPLDPSICLLFTGLEDVPLQRKRNKVRSYLGRKTKVKSGF